MRGCASPNRGTAPAFRRTRRACGAAPGGVNWCQRSSEEMAKPTRPRADAPFLPPGRRRWRGGVTGISSSVIFCASNHDKARKILPRDTCLDTGNTPTWPERLDLLQWHSGISSWYLFYGGASQKLGSTGPMSKLSAIYHNRQLGLREISITWEPAHSK
jgi:hypothetical protein